MKILIITDAWQPQTNGVVRTYENLIPPLTAQGHEVRVMGPPDFPIRFPMPFYKEIDLVLPPYGRLKRLICDYKADHLHIATEGPLGRAARRYCLKHGLPFTTCYHTQFPDYVARRVRKIFPKWERRARNYAWKQVREFHAPSHAMMVATPSLEAQLKDRTFKNPMVRFTRGVDVSLFHTGEKNLFRDLPQPVALYVGRIAVEKSIEDFLEMEWHGSKVIVGDGPSRAELEAAHPDAHFVGKKMGKELADQYRSADVFVFPSRTDTFGMVLIEALACGLPIAAYPVTGPIDIITEPLLGVLDDDLSRAAHLAVSLISPDLRKEHVKEHYSWETAAQQFMNAVNSATPASQQTQSSDG